MPFYCEFLLSLDVLYDSVCNVCVLSAVYKDVADIIVYCKNII